MERTGPEPQAVVSPVSSYAIFIGATTSLAAGNASIIRNRWGDVAAFIRAVGKRARYGHLSCVSGFGARAPETPFNHPRSANLRGLRSGNRVAVSTPGDIRPDLRAFHIGNLDHTDTTVRLYLRETFTFLMPKREASVPVALSPATARAR